MRKLKINYNNRRINIKARELSSAEMAIGLMFSSRNKENLFFDFLSDEKHAIHSLFVFYPFLAVWLDYSNTVIDYRIIRPFEVYIVPSKKFRKLIEIPLNKKNNKIINFFVEKRKV